MQARTMTPTRPGWPHSWRRRALATTALMSASLLAHTALAQATWTGAVSSDFDTAGNWSEGVVPDSTSLSFVRPRARPL
ncbi:hypothetical protein [Cereibacter changlensis]|uniref:Uncharacterized protein n=1 Tax=Cereibacter changlensis TaxID=402884 RepID=A0A2W7SZ80_9RHOB|nr:hypothetical protein [Cereibacter changlensis]PZX56152.1 hypothetical protein LX76_01181 [Cereibacter changlensis]